MVKLVCVLTLARTAPFFVDLDERTTVDELKKQIKSMNEDTVRCDADKLRLYLAKRDGKWFNNWDAFGLKCDFQDLEHLKYPQMSLKYAGLGNSDTILPSYEELIERNGLIHVVVVVPVQAQDPRLNTCIIDAVDEAIKARDEKRNVFSFANCPSVKVEELKRNLGLSTKLLDINEAHASFLPGFVWHDESSDGTGSRKACMAYMNTYLRGGFYSGETQTFFLDMPDSDDPLLSINDARMEFAVKGTADLVIVDKRARQYRDVHLGLWFLIEVKQDLLNNVESYRRQLLLKLIVADFKSAEGRAPVGLMTDLNNAWYFFWFTSGKEIATLLLECPVSAFRFICGVLNGGRSLAEGGISTTEPHVVNYSNVLKRERLADLVPLTIDTSELERFESISEYLSPEFMREQRLLFELKARSQMPDYSSLVFEQEK